MLLGNRWHTNTRGGHFLSTIEQLIVLWSYFYALHTKKDVHIQCRLTNAVIAILSYVLWHVFSLTWPNCDVKGRGIRVVQQRLRFPQLVISCAISYPIQPPSKKVNYLWNRTVSHSNFPLVFHFLVYLIPFSYFISCFMEISALRSSSSSRSFGLVALCLL